MYSGLIICFMGMAPLVYGIGHMLLKLYRLIGTPYDIAYVFLGIFLCVLSYCLIEKDTQPTQEQLNKMIQTERFNEIKQWIKKDNKFMLKLEKYLMNKITQDTQIEINDIKTLVLKEDKNVDFYIKDLLLVWQL